MRHIVSTTIHYLICAREEKVDIALSAFDKKVPT